MLKYRDINKSQRSRFCHEQYLGRTPGGAGATGLQTPPQTHKSRNIRNTDFIRTIVSNVLRDSPFRRNQPPKSDDE